MSSGRYNEQGLAGAIYKPGSTAGNNISSVEGFKKIRELSAVQDKLYKEIEKLNNRNDMLAIDATKLRNTSFSQQREIKILRNVNEKVGTEKNQLTAEYAKCKEQRDKLEMQFNQLSDATLLQSHIDSLKLQIDSLNGDLYKAQNKILDRDDTIKKLKEEIDALNIALDNHAHYDKGGGKRLKNNPNDTLSRETLRDMCYNMAKKEAELHNMSVSLADVFAKLEKAAKENEELSYDKDSLQMQLNESLERFEVLGEVLEKTNEDKTNLQQKNGALQSTHERLEQMIEDLSRRNAESRQSKEETTALLAEKKAELKALQDEYHTAVSSLKKRLEASQVAMAHKDSIMAMSEQRLSNDRDKLAAERERNSDKLLRVDYLENQIELIRSNSLTQIEERDLAVSQLEGELLSSRTDLERYRRDLSASSEKASVYDQLTKERDTLSEALQSAMATSKGVKAKLQHEIKRRELAETTAETAEERARTAEENMRSSEQSKSQYSFAVLDAYQQEREKSTMLETELNILRSSLNTSSVRESDTDSNKMPMAAAIKKTGSAIVSTASPDPVNVVGDVEEDAVTAVRSSVSAYRQSAESTLRDSETLPPTPPLSPERGNINERTIYHSPQRVSTDGTSNTSSSGDGFSIGGAGADSDSPDKKNNSNIVATHDLIGTIQRIRGDLNRVITEDRDDTVYYDNNCSANTSASDDDIIGTSIDLNAAGRI